MKYILNSQTKEIYEILTTNSQCYTCKIISGIDDNNIIYYKSYYMFDGADVSSEIIRYILRNSKGDIIKNLKYRIIVENSPLDDLKSLYNIPNDSNKICCGYTNKEKSYNTRCTNILIKDMEHMKYCPEHYKIIYKQHFKKPSTRILVKETNFVQFKITDDDIKHFLKIINDCCFFYRGCHYIKGNSGDLMYIANRCDLYGETIYKIMYEDGTVSTLHFKDNKKLEHGSECWGNNIVDAEIRKGSKK